jgi:hypothetical protein
MKRLVRLVPLLLATAFFAGCATGRHSVADTATRYDIKPDKALVVFMRVSNVGGGISAPIFDSTGAGNELIAVLGPKEKVAYYCAPGERHFMVLGENADFMDARLEAGKVYYAIATPRMGVWKARFSLHPFKADAVEKEFAINSPQLRQWHSECHFVRPKPSAENYGVKSAGDIITRRGEYEPKWAAMLEKDKQWRRLVPADGLAAPLP